MWTFTPTDASYATQSSTDYAALIAKLRSIYIKPIRIENGVVKMLRLGEDTVIGNIS
jgi:hypothetical protein